VIDEPRPALRKYCNEDNVACALSIFLEWSPKLAIEDYLQSP
jgi:hypothetical protein